MVPDTGHLDPAQVHHLYWDRPQPSRVPEPGDLLWYRHDPGSARLQPVQVESVNWGAHPDPSAADPNVWTQDAAGRQVHRRDPAPLVTFVAGGLRVECREARVPGAAGWMWPTGPTAKEPTP